MRDAADIVFVKYAAERPETKENGLEGRPRTSRRQIRRWRRHTQSFVQPAVQHRPSARLRLVLYRFDSRFWSNIVANYGEERPGVSAAKYSWSSRKRFWSLKLVESSYVFLSASESHVNI